MQFCHGLRRVWRGNFGLRQQVITLLDTADYAGELEHCGISSNNLQ